ncbi:MAG: hypothetical protein JSR62_09705 [Nitrospira sp.]|nr:hypothetical protein [Nitrospira sp.]
MSVEEDKMAVIRRYLLDALPGHDVQDGSRMDLDRTLLVFHGVEVIATLVITTALLDGSHPSALELERALRNEHVVDWVLSSPVVYLQHNTLGIAER